LSRHADTFLRKTLGEGGMAELAKFELYKPGTNTVVDHEELKTALQIVPRAVLSFLYHKLEPMKQGEHLDTELPVDGRPAMMHIDKLGPDVYSGTIDQEGKKVAEFKNRTLPSVGLVIMTAFEMYGERSFEQTTPGGPGEDLETKVQKLVDDRVALHALVDQVVSKKLEQREAVGMMLLRRLGEAAQAQGKPEDRPAEARKPRALSQFLRTRALKKSKPREFVIEMAKGESADCPDCGKVIFAKGAFSACVCYGDDMQRKVFVRKHEKGVQVRFSKGWDPENIEMLLEALRRRNSS